MEAFSLLKYWRTGAVAGDNSSNARSTSTSASATTIVTAVSEQSSGSEEGNDDGPFFDLEFALPDDDGGEGEAKDEDIDGSDCVEVDGEEKEEDSDSDELDGDDGREMKFTLSSVSSGDSIDQNVSLSPSDDLFFKGRLVPIEPSSLVFNSTDTNSKSQFPVSLVKSATKFRVMMLKLKKSRANVPEKVDKPVSDRSGNKKEVEKKQKQSQSHRKFLAVKFKVEEVPIVSLFTRDNSSKVVSSKAQKQNSDESSSEEKLFSKDVMQRYLKKVKPFYVRASKRYGEKLRFSGQLNVVRAATAEQQSSQPCTAGQKPALAKSTEAKSETEQVEAGDTSLPGNAKSERAGNLPAGLRVVYKRLGKSRSASSGVAAAPSAAAASKRRDDSLLQQQDGIQSAILHCKRSFKASRDSDSSIPSSVSDQSQDV